MSALGPFSREAVPVLAWEAGQALRAAGQFWLRLDLSPQGKVEFVLEKVNKVLG